MEKHNANSVASHIFPCARERDSQSCSETRNLHPLCWVFSDSFAHVTDNLLCKITSRTQWCYVARVFLGTRARDARSRIGTNTHRTQLRFAVSHAFVRTTCDLSWKNINRTKLCFAFSSAFVYTTPSRTVWKSTHRTQLRYAFSYALANVTRDLVWKSVGCTRLRFVLSYVLAHMTRDFVWKTTNRIQ